jgi:hypothetical protein
MNTEPTRPDSGKCKGILTSTSVRADYVRMMRTGVVTPAYLRQLARDALHDGVTHPDPRGVILSVLSKLTVAPREVER